MSKNNVRIAIRDSTDSHNVGFFDNVAGVKYKSANLQRFLAGSASILTIKYNSKDIDSIRTGCKLAFRYKSRDYWLNVMSFEKKGYEVELTAYSLGLELNNEERGEHKPNNAMSIAEYVAYYDPEHALTIGVNEVSDKRIKLEWTGTDTILARLFSVANSFGAELDFSVELNDDYSLKRQVLNIYKKGNLGTNKVSQPVRVGKELKVINYSDNIKELKTAVRATGKDGLTIDGLNKKIYDNNKELLYYSSGMTVYAPQSRDRFPSVGKGSNDNWIVEDLGETQYETKDSLWGYLYSEIQKKSLPEITYEVEGAIDAGIGDTQILIDDVHYDPTLYVQARVSELEDDILTGKVTKSTFINFERKYSQIADELQKRVNELVEASIPYTIKVSSDNGTVFKNSTGTSTFKARVFKGEKEITSDVSWRWALDGNVTVGMQYLVKAKDIDETAVLTVAGYVGNTEVATTEITLTNVNDGSNGSKGDDGVGIDHVSNYYLATAQLNSVEPLGDNLLINADMFNDWISVSGGDGTATVISVDNAPLEEVTKAIRVVDNTTGNKDLRYKNALSLEVGEQYTISCFARVASDSPKSSVTLLMRSWTTNDTDRKLVQAISHTDWQFYSFTFTADVVSNGIQFGQTGAGIIEICAPRLVKNQQSFAWTSSIQLITEAQRYLWHYRVEHYTDNTEKTTAPMIIGVYGNRGESGKDGVAGKDGVGLKSTVVTYGLSTSETTQPSSWTAQVPTLAKGNYLWTKTVWTYTDNTTETGYQKTYIAKDGNDGADGIAGKDGVGIESTTITYTSSTSGITKPSSGWSSTIPSVPAGNYLWTKTVWTYTDGTNETGYSVAKMGENGVGILKTWNFYKLSNSTSAPQVVPIGSSTNLSHLGPNNAWTPYKELSGGSAGWNLIDFDKIAKSNIIPDKPFTWYLEASFDGVSNFNGSTDFNIRFENWYVNSAGSNVYNPLGTRDFQANKFSATNDTSVNNYFSQSITWTVPRAVYDAIPEGGFLNLRIRIDRFTKLFHHAKNSYVTYGTVPSDPAQRGLGNYSTYGWKANPEAVTQVLPYLWIYQVQLYDNGKEVAIPPTLIGAQGIQGLQGPKGDQGLQGPKGADGKTQYTHIAYADDATGGGFSQTDQTKAYIGMYVDFTATDSNDPTKYKWTKWKGSDGAQGIPGPKGADGKTPYIHFAYADDDKGTNFSLTDNNQQFQGYYSDYTQADSTDYTKYTWVDRLANVQVGGRNYIRDFGFANNQHFNNHTSLWKYERIADSTARSGYYIKATCISAGNNGFHRSLIDLRGAEWQGRTMTYSIDIKASKSVRMRLGAEAFNKGYKTFDVTTDWQRFISTDTVNFKTFYSFPFYSDSEVWAVDDVVYIRDPQLEDGNVATTPIPALEDTQEQIDSKADSALTQEQLNALEAKRLQMETEMKALATLEQVSELETFINNLKQEDTDGRQKIIETTKAIEERVKDIAPIMEYSQKLQFMDTYITQGNGGMVIGANDSSTKVVVTPDRISFQSGGSEVAYISQSMLHIDNGVFTMSLQLGHYITRAHPKNKYVNATYFVK